MFGFIVPPFSATSSGTVLPESALNRRFEYDARFQERCLIGISIEDVRSLLDKGCKENVSTKNRRQIGRKGPANRESGTDTIVIQAGTPTISFLYQPIGWQIFLLIPFYGVLPIPLFLIWAGNEKTACSVWNRPQSVADGKTGFQ